MVNNTALRSLLSVLDVLTDFAKAQLNSEFHCNSLIFLPSKLAVSKALDSSTHKEQTISLENLQQIGELLNDHPNMYTQLL